MGREKKREEEEREEEGGGGERRRGRKGGREYVRKRNKFLRFTQNQLHIQIIEIPKIGENTLVIDLVFYHFCNVLKTLNNSY